MDLASYEDDFSKYVNLDADAPQSDEHDFGAETAELNNTLPVKDHLCGVITKRNKRCKRRLHVCTDHTLRAKQQVPRSCPNNVEGWMLKPLLGDSETDRPIEVSGDYDMVLNGYFNTNKSGIDSSIWKQANFPNPFDEPELLGHSVDENKEANDEDDDDNVTSLPVSFLFGSNFPLLDPPAGLNLDLGPEIIDTHKQTRQEIRALACLRQNTKFIAKLAANPNNHQRYFMKFIKLALNKYVGLSPMARWKVVLAEREATYGWIPLNQ
ncbi:unnamed protein product [Kuraishia capsulata CBS 1993]|uniref:Uncharacterized protein n=1 Tax=Kuraishia capsulata CBS 1993 TaxID=1382522 RepID=W6MK46_9ASCO|nr:uncharacterized protein KUCA_T00002335001 [Kuraishia capsulata CBS 1993]CDK26363.1 unnamed protein product [Kuraishia capsulata CBS 1993]